ncbi:MAG: DMT family transporter [Magnetovibrio sp.]|nr:DMT family transporter [Magnetovibrio sp.]
MSTSNTMNVNKKWVLIADLSLIFVAMVWGASYAISKEVLTFVPVLSLITLRFTLALVIIAPITYRELRRSRKQDIYSGILLGLILSFIFMSETFGVFYTTATNAAFLISLCIVMTPILDAIVHGKKPSITIICCAVVSCLGTAFMVLTEGLSLNSGDILILIAAFLRAIMVVSTKHLMRDNTISSASLTCVQLLTVTTFTGTLALIFNDSKGLSLTSSYEFWVALFFLSGFCTLAAFYIQNTAVRLTNPTRVSFLMGTEPIFGAIFASILLSESMTVMSVIGASLILIGSYFGARYASSVRE